MKTKLLKKVRKRFEILDRPKGGLIFDHFWERPHLLIYDKGKAGSMFAHYDLVMYGGAEIKDRNSFLGNSEWRQTLEDATIRAKELLMLQILATYNMPRTKHKRATAKQRKVWHVEK